MVKLILFSDNEPSDHLYVVVSCSVITTVMGMSVVFYIFWRRRKKYLVLWKIVYYFQKYEDGKNYKLPCIF